MKKLIFVFSLLVFLILIGYYSILYFIRKDLQITKNEMLKANFTCPPNSVEKIQEWSKSGFARFCEKDRKKHGAWMAWESGKLKMESQYLEGVLNGQFLIWYQNEKKYKMQTYAKGEKHGVYIEWFKNGNKKVQGQYLEGVKSGVWNYWNEFGEQKSVNHSQ